MQTREAHPAGRTQSLMLRRSCRSPSLECHQPGEFQLRHTNPLSASHKPKAPRTIYLTLEQARIVPHGLALAASTPSRVPFGLVGFLPRRGFLHERTSGPSRTRRVRAQSRVKTSPQFLRLHATPTPFRWHTIQPQSIASNGSNGGPEIREARHLDGFGAEKAVE